MGKFKFNKTDIDGVYVIEPTIYGDERGYFMETYSETEFKEAGIKSKVEHVTTAKYEKIAGKTVAKRPFNSRLDKSKLLESGFQPLPDYRDALKRFLK